MRKTVFALSVFFVSSLGFNAFADQTSISADVQIPQQQTVESQNIQLDIEDKAVMPQVVAETETSTQTVVQPQQPVLNQKESEKETKEEKNYDDKIHPYIRADIGITYTSFEVDYNSDSEKLSGMQGMCNLAAGIKYKKGRFELAYQKRDTMSDVLLILINRNAWVENQAVMANAFYDFVSSKYFALYIGGGAGLNMWKTELKWSGNEYNDSGTSYTAGAYLGASINTSIGFSIDFGIDYYYVNKPMMNSVVPKIGARITF